MKVMNGINGMNRVGSWVCIQGRGRYLGSIQFISFITFIPVTP